MTEVTLKIFPLPEHQILEAIHFDSIEAGISAMQKIMRLGLQPFLVRFYDEDEARHVMGSAHSSGCVMFLGHEGIKLVAEAEHAASRQICFSEGGFSLGASPVLSWMSNRFDFSKVEKVLNSQTGGFAETIELADFWGSFSRLIKV